ncbi:ABC-F type ribosomal protection protein [bacterium]|nr:ABC-F type ribosomal protection protein [bacterium]
MLALSVKDIKKSFGAVEVLRQVSFGINQGERIGLVGRNGSGKTTLFRIIAGLDKPDQGSFSVAKGLSLSYQEQIPFFPDESTVHAVLRTAFHKLDPVRSSIRAMEQEMARSGQDVDPQLLERYGELMHSFEQAGGYEIEQRLDRVGQGLGISRSMHTQLFQRLSGGEKTKVCLAKILLENPDVLLLDEPTNHLDIQALEWLEDFLSKYNGTVLLISHDRYFLDRTVTGIIELEDGQTTSYPGNYSAYNTAVEQAFMAQFEAYKDQQKKIKAMRQAIVRFREWGRRSDDPRFFKKAFNMEKRIERLEKIERPRTQKGMELELTASSRSGDRVISIHNLDKTFGEIRLFENTDLTITYGERVALLGPNGSGKSTLFRTILGEVKPDRGEVILGSRVMIGYLEQEIAFDDPSKTLVEFIRESLIVDETKARNILAAFLFYRDDVYKTIRSLSGGEKVRLRLCLLLHQENNLLLLDEPTNHLDIEARESFEESLLNYEGSMLFISHDRYFINKLAGRILEIDRKHCVSFPGNYDYYKSKKMSEYRKTGPDPASRKKEETAQKGRRDRHDQKSASNQRKADERRLARLEVEIEQLEHEKSALEHAMIEQGFDHQKLAEMQQSLDELHNKLDSLLAEWDTLVDS